MADDAQQDEMVIEEWTEPVDLTTLGDDGPSTIFVGGCSELKTAKDGLEHVIYRNDRVVFLSGAYDGDLFVDSVLLDGVDIRGDGAVTFEGRLVVGYSSFDPDRVLKVPQAAEGDEAAPPPAADGEDAAPPAAEEEVEDDEEGGKKAEPARPQLLSVGNMSFLGGLMTEGLSKGYVDDCVFGTPIGEPALDHCGTVAPLSTVQFARCNFFGSGKSVLYGFPRAQCSFTDCAFAGAVKPVTNAETVRRKRGYVPPPPPPPTAPTSVQCEVGLYLDDADVKLTRAVVSRVAIGLLCHDVCKGTVVTDSAVSLTSATGILLLDKASPHIARTMVSLNGREALVVGNDCHPNVRNCSFAGDVRLKTQAIHTGLTDNVIGLNKELLVEGRNFNIKGFTIVATDPTVVKPKKVVVEEEE